MEEGVFIRHVIREVKILFRKDPVNKNGEASESKAMFLSLKTIPWSSLRNSLTGTWSQSKIVMNSPEVLVKA